MDMQQKEQSSSLIDFFRNYQFPDQSIHFHKLQFSASFQQQELVEYLEHLRAIVKKLQNSLEVSVLSACKLIEIFKQQEQHKNSEYYFLNQEYNDFKQMTSEDKKQNQKFLQESREIIEEWKKQLLQKEYQYRQICDKLQEKETCILVLKKQEKYLNDKYQSTIKSYNQIYDQFDLNNRKTEELSSQLQRCQIELEKTEEINQKIYAENYYLKTVNEELLKKIEKITQNCINKKDIQNEQLQSQIKFIDIDDESSLEKSQEEQNESIFQLQDMNSSLQNPNVLKDVLNISEQNIKLLNMTRQFLRSKQKQNWGQNYLINRTNSSKKEQIYMQQHYSNGKQIRRKSIEDEPKVLTSTDNQIRKNKSFRQVKQFCMNEFNHQQHQHIDPYFTFFILTIQCVKINSKHFQNIAGLDLDSEWNNVIQKRIPLNQWQQYIKKIILQQSGFEA